MIAKNDSNAITFNHYIILPSNTTNTILCYKRYLLFGEKEDMTFMCHGICDKYAVMTLHKDWWNLGLKSCRNCRMCFDRFRNCPCCGRQLSMRTVSGAKHGLKKQAYVVRYVK